MATLPVCKATSAFQALSDTGFTAQPRLVQRMLQGQVPLLVGTHAVDTHSYVILKPHRVGHTFESDRSLIAATTANVQALWRGQALPLLCNPQALALWKQRLQRTRQD